MNKHIRKHQKIAITGLFSISLMIVSMVLGFLFNSYYQARKYLDILSAKNEIAVFLDRKSENTPEVISEFIRNMDDVTNIKYVSPADALKSAMEKNEKYKDIFIENENPFTPYFLIKIENITPAKTESLKDQILGIKGVDEVLYDGNMVSIIENLTYFKNIYYFTGKITIIAVFLLAFGITLWRILHRTANYLDVLGKFLSGSVSGILGALIFYALSYYLFPYFIIQMPLKFIGFIVPCSVVLAFVRKNNT